MIVVGLAIMLAGAPANPSQSTMPALASIDCQKLLAATSGPGVTDLCEGEAAMRTADSVGSQAERQRRLLLAAASFDRASDGLRDTDLKVYALEALARLFDAKHLNQPLRMEQAFRALVPLMPGSSSPLRRVAQLQEDQGLVDAAESSLLDAKQQAPDDVEIYQALSHFYARRAVAIGAAAAARVEPGTDRSPAPGEPDADGYYLVGGNVTPPAPVFTPFPERPRGADAARASGVVALEIRVDESGIVAGARVIRSVPALDDTVLSAIRSWRYDPAMRDGRAVPVKLIVAVNVPLASK